MKRDVWVFFDIDGRFADGNELQVRNAVVDELRANNIGEYIGAGSGRGEVDFQFHVTDVPAALELIGKAIEKHAGASDFRIKVKGIMDD